MLAATMGVMHRYSLGAYPQAVCVDSTPAMYYFLAATSVASANTWIVYLRGGGLFAAPCCFEAASVQLNPDCRVLGRHVPRRVLVQRSLQVERCQRALEVLLQQL